MKLKRPSPAMTVAVVALVMSMTGGAIAAVNFAENAGSVDGYSAVKATKAGKGKAAGKLVATYADGDNRGRLPLRIIAGAASENSVENLAEDTARGRNGARLIAVADNQTTAAETMIDLSLGALQVSCADQNNNAAIENATTRVTVTNSSGVPMNLSRTVGNAAPGITTIENGIADTFSVPQENTFSIQLQGTENKTVLVEGTARQIGQGTADSSCAVWATAVIVD
ncbi:MAG: hypothetical protein ACRDJY_09240 [Thermoleophilaceae bacterium]